jgi:hypothetical protein
MLDRPTTAQPRSQTPEGLRYRRLSRSQFRKEWQKGRLSHIHFGRAAARNGIDPEYTGNVVGYLTDMAKATAGTLRMGKNSPNFVEFCRTAGLSRQQVDDALALLKDPAEYAYCMMAGYNQGRDIPDIHFALGRGKSRYYVGSVPE